MSRLVLTSTLLRELRSELLRHPEETCAILFAQASRNEGNLTRMTVREVLWPTPQDYEERTPISAQLRPRFIAAITQQARRSGQSLVFVHSHPFGLNQFSATDDAGEKVLAEFLESRIPGVPHAALLVTPQVTIARVLGTPYKLQVSGIGPVIAHGCSETSDDGSEQYDRQIRMFGADGQYRLRQMRIGVVGLGGTGSLVVEQLAHLGIRDFCLIDPDVVEATNLNRLVGATPADVGRSKVEVACNAILRTDPAAKIQCHRHSVLMASVAEELTNVDFVFCCTDSQGSRSVLNQLAYQFLIPMIDMGVSIVVGTQGISHIAGRTQMLAPELGCQLCGNLLDPEAVRVDLLTEFERSADPYVMGAHEPAPSVISLNSTVASMAVSMFLSAALGVPGTARLINYNGITGTARSAAISRHPTCIVCSPEGAFARAHEWPVPGRLL